MSKTIAELKQHFEALVADQGCVCEADYHSACLGVPEEVISVLDSWLVSSRLKLKKGIGEQYKQELLQRVRNPNVRDVKDTKEHTHNNPDKKQKSKAEPEERQASVTINKIIDELKDKDTKDEFLPPWKKREAAVDVSEASFAQWKDWLLDFATKNVPAMMLDAWLAYIPSIETAGDLDRAWKQLQGGDFEVPVQEEAAPREEFRYVDLPEGDEEEPLELDIKKSSFDPVEAHLIRVAQAEYNSKMKKKVKFDNDVVFTVDVAETPAQKSAGLEVFEELPESRGLLFPFERPDHVTFHMGRVKFPIDILFFMHDDLGFRVAKVVHNANPGDMDLWSNPRTACVLEIPGGSCAKYGIGVDSYCKISDRVEV